jgi:MATE family multidrug resistance protein
LRRDVAPDDLANAGVLALAVSLSVYAGFFQLIDGALIVFANGLRGLRDTQSTFWITVIGYWMVGLGTGTWLCLGAGYGAPGLWYGLIGGALAGLILMASRLHRRLEPAALRPG